VKDFSISLQNRLALSYAVFIGAALALLAVIINIFTGVIFNGLVKKNIDAKSAEIVRTVGAQYQPLSGGFDSKSIETIGMYFVHEGYIVTVEDEGGAPVWDARSCDMEECRMVVNDIALRMEGRFGLDGAPRKERYPVMFAGREAGTVTIETYGPFFYSETEAAFLTSINRLLIIAAVLLASLTALVSAALARAIARPINSAAAAARQIARAHSQRTHGAAPSVRIDGKYQTRELSELAGAINELAAGLEEGERRQMRQSSDIAHELRTPLTCLQGSLEAMIDGVYKADRARLESCHEEIVRLTGLIEDLNTLTNFEWENISLNKTVFDAAALLRSVAEQFKAAVREKGIFLKLEIEETPVFADYDRLKQVLINLLSNAVKYTDEGGITVHAEKKAEGAVEIVVADTGIGVAEDELSRIFERFYRTDKSRSRGTGGGGIGLTIAAAIVHAHGGTLLAGHNRNSRGTVLRVRLKGGGQRDEKKV
jgi:signal transduction histidine kinase